MDYEKAIEKLGNLTEPLRNVPEEIQRRVIDIKIAANRPVTLFCGDKLYFVREDGSVSLAYGGQCLTMSHSEIENLFYKLCGYAVYSHIHEIQSGYIAVDRSLRVGIAGTAVVENGCLKTVREITGLSIRIPRQVIGCAVKVLREGVEPQHGVLIAGAPSTGKTTLLRDLARVLGDSGHRTVVLDERFELLSDGFQLGLCTEVLQGYPKSIGCAHAIRCLSPEYILCDELGDDDLPELCKAAFAGVALIATVHAGNVDELQKRPLCRKLLESGIFTYIVLLQKSAHVGSGVKVFRVGDILETEHGNSDHSLRLWAGSS